jgi:arginine deiminase
VDIVLAERARLMSIAVEISPGELIDKLTILEIKLEKISDPDKLKNIRREHDSLTRTFRQHVHATPELTDLMAQLKTANSSLWRIEDDIRDHERTANFGESFVKLARSVYRMNDQRSAIKRRINELLGSDLVEEKSYSAY